MEKLILSVKQKPFSRSDGKRIQAFNSVLHAVRFTKIQTQTALYISLLKTILVFEIGRLLPDLLP